MPDPRLDEQVRQEVQRQRWEILGELERWLEPLMALLAFVWLALFVVDLVSGLNPLLSRVSNAIWIAFIVDFLLKISLAPSKRAYLRRNLVTVLALALPAIRVLRAFRIVRLLRLTRGARGLQLLRFFTSLNRGMKALSRSLGRKGFGYVVLLTVLVVFAGAAGMYAFEKGSPSSTIDDYSSAVWWTAMVITTMGTDYFPRSPEGRLLCFILALYGFAVFGYITATVASFLVDRDRGAEGELAQLRDELRELRRELRQDRRAG